MAKKTAGKARMTPGEFREIVEESGLNNKEVAEILEVTVMTIHNRLAGSTPIRCEAAIAIRELIG